MKIIIKTAFLSMSLLLVACGSGSEGGSEGVAPAPQNVEKPAPKEDKTDKKVEVEKEPQRKKFKPIKTVKVDPSEGPRMLYAPLSIYEPSPDLFKKSYVIGYLHENMPEYGVNRCVARFLEDHGSYGTHAGYRVVHDWMVNKEEEDFFCAESSYRTTRTDVSRGRIFIPNKTSSGTVCMGSMEFNEKDEKIAEYEEVDRKYCLLP